MGIQGILQLGVLLLADVSSTTAAFKVPPTVPQQLPHAVSARDAGYVQTSWSARDGVPASSDYLVSDPSGLVLVWSAGRMHRFDGSRFSQLSNSDGSALEVAGLFDGQRGSGQSVWLSTRDGEAIRIEREDIRRFGSGDGLPAGVELRHVVEEAGETVAATGRGLYRLRAGRWSQVALPELVDRKVWHVRFDGRRWWAIVGSDLVAIERDFSALHKVAPLAEDNYSGLIGGAQSGVFFWQTAGTRNLCRLGTDPACYTLDNLSFPAIDTDGVVWWATGSLLLGYDGRTATRVSAEGAPGRMVVMDTGQLLDEVEAAVDGTLWCIAGGRLLQLVKTPIQLIPSPVGAVLPAPGGDMWVAAFETGMHRVGFPEPADPLFRTEEGHLRAGPLRPAGRGRALTAAEAGAETRPVILDSVDEGPRLIVRVDALGNGQIMAATLEAPFLWLGNKDSWRPHSAPPLDKGAVVRGVARDARGRLLVAAMRGRHGLYRFDGSDWQVMRPDGRDRTDVTALHVDVRDRIWLGGTDETITLLAGGTTRTFGPDAGLDVGVVRSIRTVGDDLWVAGMTGVARLRDDTFQTLRLDGRTSIHGISDFAFDGAGDLWLGAAQGILRVGREQWTSAIGRPSARARFTLLGEPAGVEHPIVYTAPLPTVATSADDSLWFFTLGGLYRLDPRAIPAPKPAPSLAIASVAVDGTRYAPAHNVQVPAGARRLVFAFHAMAPVVEERTAFRYRIAGLDEAWSETRDSEVVLERLPPGDYVFELQASAEDGAWNGVISTQTFSIPPTFWQSDWSKVVLVLLLCALAAIVLLLRTRQLDARRRAVAEGRLREREKIARDMHDTLLQGLNGLLMTMQAVVARLGMGSPERVRLETSIDIAERILVEGRDRVSALRSVDSDSLDLVRALQVHARDLAHERRILCEVEVVGEPASLVAVVEDELIQIGREALTNAFVHSCATEIVLRIGYAVAEVCIEVRDNGIGMRPSDDLIRKHWGIQGMQERAAAIGGRLEVGGRPEGGLGVVVRVPASAAYPPRVRKGMGSSWLRLVPRRPS